MRTLFRLFYLSARKRDPLYPYVGDVTQETPQPNQKRIVRYLEGGHVFAASPVKFIDAIATPRKIPPEYIMGGAWMTDGKWIWCREIIHYIRHYNVLVPEDFVDHMKDNRWVAPTDVKVTWRQLRRFLPEDD